MFTPDTLIGRTLGGQYRLEALLGRGGFGAVFRATDLQLQRHVAVKVIAHAATEQLADRFRREAQLQARLRHPAIVRLLHFGEDGGLFYMVQEYVDGITLKAVVDRTGPLSSDRAVSMFSDLLDALDEAHADGVVHRDLKPANIMVVSGRRGEEVRLLDFGIAKIFEESDDIEILTATGMVIGTPAWMAPEQAMRQPILPAADLYSIGCVMHYALTGRRPFKGTPVQVMLDHVKREPPPLPEHVPTPLADVIHRAMAKQPGERFPSAVAMREALTASLSHIDAATTVRSHPPVTALSDPSPDPTPLGISNISAPPIQPASGRRRGATLATIGLLILLVLSLGMWWTTTQFGETSEAQIPVATASSDTSEPTKGIGRLLDAAADTAADARPAEELDASAAPVAKLNTFTDEVDAAPKPVPEALPAPSPERSPKNKPSQAKPARSSPEAEDGSVKRHPFESSPVRPSGSGPLRRSA